MVDSRVAGGVPGPRHPTRARRARSTGSRAAGHRVHVAEVPGLGHEFPADFADRLPSLLAAAGIGSHQPATPDEARTGD